jgi:hypothetical protein
VTITELERVRFVPLVSSRGSGADSA